MNLKVRKTEIAVLLKYGLWIYILTNRTDIAIDSESLVCRVYRDEKGSILLFLDPRGIFVIELLASMQGIQAEMKTLKFYLLVSLPLQDDRVLDWQHQRLHLAMLPVLRVS